MLTFLNKIIPLEYFGTQQHRKLFFEIINRILTRSAHECVYKQHLAQGYDITKVPWLPELQDQTCEKLLIKVSHSIILIITFMSTLFPFLIKITRII